MIQLSIGKTTEHFWFSLFHEAARILLQVSKRPGLYVRNLTFSMLIFFHFP